MDMVRGLSRRDCKYFISELRSSETDSHQDWVHPERFSVQLSTTLGPIPVPLRCKPRCRIKPAGSVPNPGRRSTLPWQRSGCQFTVLPRLEQDHRAVHDLCLAAPRDMRRRPAVQHRGQRDAMQIRRDLAPFGRMVRPRGRRARREHAGSREYFEGW